jgi:kynurenine formamidase
MSVQRLTPLILASLFVLVSCKESPVHISEPPASLADLLSNAKIVDLTHDFSDETIYWVTAKEFELEVVAAGDTDKGYYYAANNITCAEHGGTHVDAPIHFSKTGQTVDQMPLGQLIGSAIKIDVSAKALGQPDYLVSVEDFLAWEETQGMQIPDGSIVLLETGFSKFYPDKIKYLGTDQRGPEAIAQLHFPGLAPAAAKWLVTERKIHSIGIDTPSIDYGQSQYFESHVTLLEQNIPAFENLANLEQLPAIGFEIIALPMKIRGGSGAPLRIIALLQS